MRPDTLLKLADKFYALAKSEKLPEDSDDLGKILKNIEKLETYQARVKYAEKNLKHLSSGSARVTYVTPNNTVIKLAKNDRGIAQNKAEKKNLATKCKYFNDVIRNAANFAWIETDYLDKITPKEFEKMTGIHFDDFGEAIRFGLKHVASNKKMKEPKNFDKVSKSDIYKQMRSVADKCDMMPGDIARISSWGTKKGHPVLIDAGLTKKIFDEFYVGSERSSSSTS
jgi:hypothetical protein